MEDRVKVLIHSPIGIWHTKSYQSIIAMDVEGIETDILFTVYNPNSPEYDEQGKETISDWKHNIAYKMNKAREIVLEQGYDYLLNIEHDMIVPKDGLKTLLKYAKPNNVTGGLYRARPGRNPIAPLCLKVKYPNCRIDWPTSDEIVNKEIINNVYVIPFGFTLFGKEVLKKIRFNEKIDGGFANETAYKKIEKIIIPSVVCGHIDRDGTILWP